MIWSFARANQMKGHGFKDDVAITLAFTKKQAIKHFSRLYDDVNENEIQNEIKWLFRYDKVAILTSY